MYEKHNWVTGETITEDKLNHMEDGIATGGGIYTYGEVSLFDGEVTTVQIGDMVYADITLQGDLPESDISVTFNGQNYTLPYNSGEFVYYGEAGNQGPLFENYPLNIILNADVCTVYTENAGTYSLKINETVEKLTVNDGFKSALGGLFTTTLDINNNTLNKKFGEIMNANKTRLVIIKAFYYESDRTEVVSDVNTVELELTSICYNPTNGEVKISNYHADDLNSYPVKDEG